MTGFVFRSHVIPGTQLPFVSLVSRPGAAAARYPEGMGLSAARSLPPVPDGGPARIKGVALHGFFKWYAQEQPERLNAIITGLAPSQRALLDLDRAQYGVLPNVWYPAPLVHAVIDGILDGVSDEERKRLADRLPSCGTACLQSAPCRPARPSTASSCRRT